MSKSAGGIKAVKIIFYMIIAQYLNQMEKKIKRRFHFYFLRLQNYQNSLFKNNFLAEPKLTNNKEFLNI